MAVALVPLAFGFAVFRVPGHEFSLLKYDYGDFYIVYNQIDGGV